VGSTLTVAPHVYKNIVLIGSSGAELGVRGYMTAYDVRTGEQKWRAYATGPDSDVLIGDDFNKANPHYGQKGLGTSTWKATPGRLAAAPIGVGSPMIRTQILFTTEAAIRRRGTRRCVQATINGR